MTQTIDPPRSGPSGLAAAPSLAILPDQPERWTAHGREPLTWDQVRERVAQSDAADGTRSDLAIGDLSTWVVGPRPGDGVACLTPIPLPGRPNPGLIPMRKSAFRHLASAIGAPGDYLLGLPAKLATACVSTGLQRLDPKNTSKLLRLANGEARALASERYAPLDNELVLDVAEATLRSLGMLRDVRVTDLATGPTLAMRVVLPEVTAVKAGDVIQSGFDILNGEVLNRSVSIAPVTHRLVCLNGMRRWENGVAKRWNHVGDPERLRQAVTDGVPAILAEAQGLRQRMAVAVDRLIDDALAEIEGLTAFGFSASETRTIARDLYADRGLALPHAVDQWRDTIETTGTTVSVYDVANAITHVAQSRPVDSRLEYEERGGAYLMRRTA